MTFRILITNAGEAYDCAPDRSVLAGMEALGRSGIPAGCRGGGCGICKVRIESGEVEVQRMSRACISDDERLRGHVLACCARPRSDLVLTAVDRLARRLERGPGRTTAHFIDAALAAARPFPHDNDEGDSPWH